MSRSFGAWLPESCILEHETLLRYWSCVERRIVCHDSEVQREVSEQKYQKVNTGSKISLDKRIGRGVDVSTINCMPTDQRFRFDSKKQHLTSVCRIGTALPYEGKGYDGDIHAKMRDFGLMAPGVTE